MHIDRSTKLLRRTALTALILGVLGSVALLLAQDAPPEPPPLNSSSEIAQGAEPEQVGPAPLGRLWEGDGYRRATIRRGHGVLVYAKPDGKVLGGLHDRTEFGSKRVFSVLERRDAWLKVTLPAFDDNRPVWIRASRELLSFSTTEVSIHADLGERTLTYRQGGEARVRVPMTIGAAGTETPPGRFAVTDVIRREDGLNPVYGCCALVLSAVQDDLPESWSGGNRIGIHGTNAEIGTAASLGCMRIDEASLTWIADNVPLGAPVFVEV